MPRFSTLGLTAAVAALGLATGAAVMSPATAAPTYTILHTFNGVDGNGPQGALLQDLKGNLIGETIFGGTLGFGNIYAVSSDGSVFNSIYSFANSPDGASPMGGLRNFIGDVQLLGNDVGVAQTGGTNGLGTVFASDLSGHETTLHNFAGGAFGDGDTPSGRLLYWLPNNSYYGTTLGGGSGNESGTVYRISANGSSYKVVHVFTGPDGAGPLDGLQYGGDGNFYGVTSGGGANGNGTVFRISPSGAFKVIYSFSASGAVDGSLPEGVLASDFKGNLYGITNQGGLGGVGTIFTIRTSGAGFKTLYAFTGGTDGGNPQASLTLGITDCEHSLDTAAGQRAFAADLNSSWHGGGAPSGILYGTASTGGAGGGTVFSYNVSTKAFTVLYAFTGGLDGGTPLGKLLVSLDGNIYGTTNAGGASNAGVVFKISGGSGHVLRRSFVVPHTYR
ncbi:MAG: hypothetical protein JO098_02120 [Candidatus Eremiobacteraeota bacterium]|nr:hypothetical protein [Candidatus Eremiobacteraeota bacterium]